MERAERQVRNVIRQEGTAEGEVKWLLMLYLPVVGCVADPPQPVDAGASEVVDPYGDKGE